MHEYLLQDNQYDIVFLMERARKLGYDIFIQEVSKNGRSVESKLYFGPSVDVQRVTYDLFFGRSLVEFQPELTTAKQVGSVTVRGWDPVNKKKIEGTATREDLATQGVGAAGNQERINQAFDQREEVIVDRPLRSDEEAKRLAVRTLENISKEMVKGSGSTVGLPDLRSGNVVQIGGLGKRFSGRYFVTSTTHQIGDGGYTTQFECRREEL